MDYNLEKAVDYHYGVFPPKSINYNLFIHELVRTTDEYKPVEFSFIGFRISFLY